MKVQDRAGLQAQFQPTPKHANGNGSFSSNDNDEKERTKKINKAKRTERMSQVDSAKNHLRKRYSVAPIDQAEADRIGKRKPTLTIIEIDSSGKKPLDPRSSAFLHSWDVAISIMLIFTAVVTPFEVAFYGDDSSFTTLFWPNIIVDMGFTVDIFVSFNLAYWDRLSNMYVFDRQRIVRNYLSGMFIIDFLSILPSEYMRLVIHWQHGGEQPTWWYIFQLFRLIKLLRLLRMARILKRFQNTTSFNFSVMQIWGFGIQCLTCAHWLACGLKVIAVVEEKYMEGEEYEESWIHGYGADKMGIFQLYVTTLYWAVMTVSTIGYGDITPTTTMERMYMTVGMLLGSFLYGYIIGAVGNLIATRDRRKNEFYSLMDDLNNFMSDTRIAQPLQVKLRDFFRYKHENSNNELSRVKFMLHDMSKALRNEVAMATNSKWLMDIPIFRGCPTDFVSHLALEMTQQTHSPREHIIAAIDAPDRLLVIKKGVVISKCRIYCSGKVIGTDALYSRHSSRGYVAMALGMVDTYCIPIKAMDEVIKLYPMLKTKFRRFVLRCLFKEEINAYCAAVRKLMADDGKGSAAFSAFSGDERVQHYMRKLIEYFATDPEEEARLHQLEEDRLKAAGKIQHAVRKTIMKKKKKRLEEEVRVREEERMKEETRLQGLEDEPSTILEEELRYQDSQNNKSQPPSETNLYNFVLPSLSSDNQLPSRRRSPLNRGRYTLRPLNTAVTHTCKHCGCHGPGGHGSPH